jgi:hypothetical protein
VLELPEVLGTMVLVVVVVVVVVVLASLLVASSSLEDVEDWHAPHLEEHMLGTSLALCLYVDVVLSTTVARGTISA